MVVNTVSEAKAHLSELIEAVCAGQDVIISRAGKPVAILSAYERIRRPRTPGAMKGRIHIMPDFDALPPDLADAFGAATP